MELYETDPLADKILAYFRRRRYIDGNVILKTDIDYNPQDDIILSNIEKDCSMRNAISFSTVVQDLSLAEQQFLIFKNWLSESSEEQFQNELSPTLMPLVCHLYLDSLRTTHRPGSLKFLRRHSAPYTSDEWSQLLEQLHLLRSSSDILKYSHVKKFRESKFVVNISPRTLAFLRRCLSSKNLNLLIQSFHAWFDFVIAPDDPFISEEEMTSCGLPTRPNVVEVDCLDPGDYEVVTDSEMLDLLNEIAIKRKQSTPPPPLVVYTAHWTNGVVCGRVSHDCRYAVTGDQTSAVKFWALGETRLSPRLQENYVAKSAAIPKESSSTSQQDCGSPPKKKVFMDENFSLERKKITMNYYCCARCQGPHRLADCTLKNYTFSNFSSGKRVEKQVWTLSGHSDTVYDVAFLPDTDYLLSVSFDCTMRLWQLNDFKCSAVYRGHSSPIWGVAVSPINNFVATASHDKTARLWSLDRTFPLRIMAGHHQDVTCCAFHPNGSYLATGSPDRTLRLWSVTDGNLVRVMGCQQGQGSVATLAFSPNGQYIAAAGDDTFVWLWDLAGGTVVLKLTGHTTKVISVDWSKDGSTVAAVGSDGTVLLWSLDSPSACVGEVEPKKYITSCSNVLSIQYSSKNALVAFGVV